MNKFLIFSRDQMFHLRNFKFTTWTVNPGCRGHCQGRQILDTLCWACGRKSFQAISESGEGKRRAGWRSLQRIWSESSRRWYRRSLFDSCKPRVWLSCGCNRWPDYEGAGSWSPGWRPIDSNRESKDCTRYSRRSDGREVHAEQLQTRAWFCERCNTSDLLLWSSSQLVDMKRKLLHRQRRMLDSWRIWN